MVVGGGGASYRGRTGSSAVPRRRAQPASPKRHVVPPDGDEPSSSGSEPGRRIRRRREIRGECCRYTTDGSPLSAANLDGIRTRPAPLVVRTARVERATASSVARCTIHRAACAGTLSEDRTSHPGQPLPGVRWLGRRSLAPPREVESAPSTLTGWRATPAHSEGNVRVVPPVGFAPTTPV